LLCAGRNRATSTTATIALISFRRAARDRFGDHRGRPDRSGFGVAAGSRIRALPRVVQQHATAFGGFYVHGLIG